MGFQLVLLWMPVLTLSVSSRAQGSSAGESAIDWACHDDPSPYNDLKIQAPFCPLLLSIRNGQPTKPLISTAGHGSKINLTQSELSGAAQVINGALSTLQSAKNWQKRNFKFLELQETRGVSILFADEASSLGQMLVNVVKAELRDCALVVAYDTGYSGHALLQHLLLLHNPRQVVYVNTTEDLTRIIWTSSMCRGYFFLLDDPEPLLTFATTYQDTWDYGGRFVLVGPALQHLETFIDSYIGKRTEHIVGAVKSGIEGEWVLYMNQLYWGPGVRRINTWYRHRFTRQLDFFPDKMADFRGAVLKVSTFTYEPCNVLHRAENGTVVLRYGVDVFLVKAVARALNITLEFTETQNEETWGEKFENGSWYGLMGQLHRHEVDIGLANFFITNHWLQGIDLTAPYRTERMCFMTRTEPPLPHWQAVAFPFHKWTWLAAAVGLIVSGPTLFLLARGSGRCGGERSNLQRLGFALYYAFGVHFCEAHATLPRSTSTQIFVMFLWLYTMILTMVYSANLKSFLLVKKQPRMLESVQDLYESGLEVAGLTELYKPELATSSNPYLQGLAEVFRYYDSQEKVYPPVLEGRSVYLLGCMTLDYLINNIFTKRGVSRVRVMKEYYGFYNVALGVQRHSPLKRKFSKLMGWIRQGGLVHKFLVDSLRLDASLKRKNDGGGDASASAQEDEAAGEEGVIPLSTDHMQGLFFLTSFGWFSSLLAFTLEKAVLSV